MRTDLLPPLLHPVARVLLIAFVVLHTVLALASTGPTPATGAALILICATAAAVVLPERLPRPALPAIVAAPLVGTGLVLTTLHVEGWPGYAAWPLGATTFVALAVGLRGHRRLAWLLLGGLAAESVAWSLLEGAGPLPGLDLLVRHAGTLLLGTLFASALRRSASAVASLHAAERRQLAEGAATAAAERERRRGAEHLLALAGPALESLAAHRAAESGALRALEGRLRDEMTAAPLLTDRLNSALADARERGVDVVVLQDQRGDDLSSRSRDQAGEWLATRLDAVANGRLVARATISGTALRLSVQADDRTEVLELDRT